MTMPAWRCLFTVRITRLYSTPLLSMRACGLVVHVCLSLRIANVPGSRSTQYSVVSDIFLLLTVFCTFCSLFPTMANISLFLSH